MAAQFTCPHCGAASDTRDDFAVRKGRCAYCGKAIGLSSRIRRTLGIWMDNPFSTVGLLLLLFVGSDIVGMWLPRLLWTGREAVRAADCRRNLKQIGLAMQSYHQHHGCFPPAFIPDENGKPKHSWRVLILPFLGDAGSLYAEYRFDEPWNGPHNRALQARMPDVLRCPSDTPASASQTCYAMIVGPHAISDGPTARRATDIKDGPANTIMLAEAARAEIIWLEPRDLDTKDMTFRINAPGRLPPQREADIASHHSGMAKALFCDGTVRNLDANLREDTVKALLTIDGGEAVEPP